MNIYIYPKPQISNQGNPMLHSEFEHTSLLSDLKGEIIEMRGAIDTIENSMLMPMPFQYYHMGTTHARAVKRVAKSQFPLKAVVFKSGYRTLVRF